MPARPKIHLGMPGIQMASAIQIAPMTIRRIASLLCTFLVFASKSMFGSLETLLSHPKSRSQIIPCEKRCQEPERRISKMSASGVTSKKEIYRSTRTCSTVFWPMAW